MADKTILSIETPHPMPEGLNADSARWAGILFWNGGNHGGFDSYGIDLPRRALIIDAHDPRLVIGTCPSLCQPTHGYPGHMRWKVIGNLMRTISLRNAVKFDTPIELPKTRLELRRYQLLDKINAAWPHPDFQTLIDKAFEHSMVKLIDKKVDSEYLMY